MADFELPGYDVYERIGRGGMATVYRALHLNLDREVAIKVMDPSMNKDESFSERFIREARISARLTHPHILQIYDVNTYEGLNYIAMELLPGGELADFIQGEMPQKQIYQILRQMTDALDYAAGRGYVHRDIKPSNIMLRSDSDFVLADFGIARAADSGTQMTQTGLMVGTPSYMSPEQAKGQEVDGRSDLYALAVLAYEMLTKKLPYESDSAVTTAVKHLTDDIPTLPEHLSAYQGFLDKGLAKSADDRFQTGREFYAAFMAASSGFEDDQVLTEAAAPVTRSASGVLDEGGEKTSLAGVEATRLSQSSSPAISSSSRPYRLEGSMQRERLVSGTYAAQGQKKSGGALGWVAVAAVVAGLGVGGYLWWQSQQGTASKDLRNVTAELAAAYSAMNEEDLSKAARSFRKVLGQDRNNAAAQQGMEQLEPLYTTKIEQAIAEKDPQGLNELILDYSAYFPGSLKLEGFTADLELLQEEMRLTEVQTERIERLSEQAEALAANGDFAAARQALEQAAALNAGSERIADAQLVIDEAEAASAAYEERWASYSAEDKAKFQDSLTAADEALAGADLGAAEAAIAAAAAIADDAPELQARQQRLAAAREQIAAEVAAEQERIGAVLDEADTLAGQIHQDPGNAISAVSQYQQILEQYPDNARAAEGLQGIVDHYLDIARQSAAEGDFDSARQAVSAGEEVLPGNSEIVAMSESLPEMEQAWEQRQAELAAAREAEQAALQKAQEAVDRGMRALGSGALDVAQEAYDEVAAGNPDMDSVRQLQQGLVQGYAQAAREQIDQKEFDSARDIISTGAGHFPDDALWVELEAEIDTAQASSRRRLGAY